MTTIKPLDNVVPLSPLQRIEKLENDKQLLITANEVARETINDQRRELVDVRGELAHAQRKNEKLTGEVMALERRIRELEMGIELGAEQEKIRVENRVLEVLENLPKYGFTEQGRIGKRTVRLAKEIERMAERAGDACDDRPAILTEVLVDMVYAKDLAKFTLCATCEEVPSLCMCGGATC